MSDSVDAIVVGAGPVGCAAAHALADRGARVVVVERMERGPASPFAVEWLHPTAADVLLRWGLALPEAGHVRGTGVSMHLADEGHEPVVVPYRRGMRAVSMPHAELVDALRDSVVKRPEVEVLTCARVTAATPDGTVRLTRDGQETRLRADLVVAADGRSSGIRRALFGHTPQTVVSHSAGVVLEGPGLPVYESFQVASEVPGHGVAIYSIAPDAIRVVLDVPPTHPRPPALHAYLHRHFVPADAGGAAAAAGRRPRDGPADVVRDRFSPPRALRTGPARAGRRRGRAHPPDPRGRYDPRHPGRPEPRRARLRRGVRPGARGRGGGDRAGCDGALPSAEPSGAGHRADRQDGRRPAAPQPRAPRRGRGPPHR
ncbi:FAD-dependent oxidoreductase [Streptomyces sp. GLT-R25]